MTRYAQAGTMLHPAAELRNASSTTPYRAAGRGGLPRSLASDAALSPSTTWVPPSDRLTLHLAHWHRACHSLPSSLNYHSIKSGQHQSSRFFVNATTPFDHIGLSHQKPEVTSSCRKPSTVDRSHRPFRAGKAGRATPRNVSMTNAPDWQPKTTRRPPEPRHRPSCFQSILSRLFRLSCG